MFNLNLLLYIMTIVAIAKGQQQIANRNNHSNTILRLEDYLNFNRQQHAKNIQEFDIKMEIFKEKYSASIETINIKRDMLLRTIQLNEEKLNPLMVLSNVSKNCVNKYITKIPTIEETNKKFDNCITPAKYKMNNLLYSPLYIRNNLHNHYNNNFEKNVTACNTIHHNLPLNNTLCLTKVVSDTHDYTIAMQNSFISQMDMSQCNGDASIKEALDCSYTIEHDTIASITKANTLIDKCLLGQDECNACTENYTCSEIFYLYPSEVDYESKTMNNPFYKRYKAKECMLMKII